MPTYDYICPGCDHEFEFNSTIFSRDNVWCPICLSLCKRQFGSRTHVLVKGDFVERSDSFVAQHVKENYFS